MSDDVVVTEPGTGPGMPGKPQCGVCGKYYKNANSLRQHELTAHRDVIPLKRPGRATSTAIEAPPADDLVQAVLKALYPDGMVPLAHLPLIEQYKAATAAFIQGVSR